MFFLTIASLLLALFATCFAWLEFPLSASVNAYQISGYNVNYFLVPFAVFFQALILSGTILALYERFSIGLVLVLAALVLLLLIPWHIIGTHPDWLITYVSESQERQQLYTFTQEFFVSNIIAEPAYTPVLMFETLTDQLGIVLSMLSVGWYLALAANVTLVACLFKKGQYIIPIPFILCLSLLLGLLPIYRSIFTLAKASDMQYQGDKSLANEQAYNALQYYSQALKLNSILYYSTPFLLNVSRAYMILTEERHPSNTISKAWTVIQQKRILNQSGVMDNHFRRARRLLREGWEGYIPITTLEQALNDFRKRLITQLWIGGGLSQYQQGNLHKAMQSFEQTSEVKQARTSQFYLASLYIKLNSPQPALELLIPHVDSIAHPSIKADIYCTLGDAYMKANNWLKARESYFACTKWDDAKNYRVTRALSGF